MDDQYLVGEALLVAPILHGEGHGPEIIRNGVKMQERSVLLPPGWWFDLNRGEWVQGDRLIQYAAALDELPLFVRDGAVVPYYARPLQNSFMNWHAVELHLFCRDQPAQLDYILDDQETRRYQTGAYGVAHLTARVEDEGLRVEITATGRYPRDTVSFTPVVYGRPELQELELIRHGHATTRQLQTTQREWLCRQWAVLA